MNRRFVIPLIGFAVVVVLFLVFTVIDNHQIVTRIEARVMEEPSTLEWVQVELRALDLAIQRYGQQQGQLAEEVARMQEDIQRIREERGE